MADLPALPPELDPRRARRHRPSTRRGSMHSLSLITKVLAGALSLVLVVYIGYLWHTVRGINDVQKLSLAGLGTTQPAAPTKAGATPTPYQDIDGSDQNILIVGNDDRSQLTNAQVAELKVGRDGGSLNTDTMMIVHVPADGSKATLISLPRDSYVNIPGYGMNRLNAAYALAYNDASGNHLQKVAAGADKLIEVVKQLTGLTIDHFVQTSLLGFVEIADAIPGGVTVNLCHNVNDTVAHNRSIGLTGGSGLVLSKGVHKISGVTALEFVRQRENLPRGDIDRTARQRYFLTSAFRSIASAGILLNPGELSNLIGAVKKAIYVDSGLNMLDLARQMSNLSANNITGTVIPTDHYATVDLYGYQSDVGIVIPSQVQAMVQKLVDGPSSKAYLAAKPVDPKQVSVTVLNEGGSNGAATRAAAALTQAGMTAKVDASATGHLAATTIEYPAGSEAQAKTLARYVPGAAVKQAAVSGIVLIMGGDRLSAKSVPSHVSPSTAKKKSKTAIDAGCIN